MTDPARDLGRSEVAPRDDPWARHVGVPLGEADLLPLDPRCRRLALPFDRLPADSDLARLAELLERHPDVELHVTGHSSIRDLRFLRSFPRLRRLSVRSHGLRSVEGIESLPSDLVSLSIGATRTRAISLRFLERFPALEALFLEGQKKHIESVGSLRSLETLTLRSVTLPSLGPLRPLAHLRRFALHLGGTRDLALLPEIGHLRYLEIWRVRGLEDLAPISGIENVEFLFLQALPGVTRLPDLRRLHRLRRVELRELRALEDISTLAGVPSLEELLVLGSPRLDPTQFDGLERLPNLRGVSVELGSARRRDAVLAKFGGRPLEFVWKDEFSLTGD